MKQYYSKKLIILIFIIINVLLLNEKISFAEETKQNHILVLNSYNKGYLWSDEIMDGIESALKNDNNIIRIEYMDTKTIKDEKHLNNLYELYKHKFSDYKFDVIIANDNDAYNFLKKYHKELFKDTPVICCGLNTFDDFITNKNNMFTGIAETVDIKDTIDIACKLHPSTNNVVFITDESLFGDINIDLINKVAPLYKEKIKVNFFQKDSIKDVVQYVKKIPENSIILQCGLYKDEFGELIPTKIGSEIISKAANVPVYTSWEMFLGEGVIGGRVTGSYYQGQAVAKMALEILNGHEVYEIPFIEKSTNKYIFDYNSINKYNISKLALPKDSIIKNTPSHSFEITKDLLYFSILLIVSVLLFINIILFKIVNKLKKVEKDILKEKEVLQSILNSTADGIIVVDKNWNVIHHNNRFGEIWNLPKEVLARINEYEVFDFVKEHLLNPEEASYDVQERLYSLKNYVDIINFKDGKVLERLSQPLILDGKINGVVWNYRDITEKIELEKLEIQVEIKERLLEEAKKYDKMKDEFLATVSHELKTPLNIILGVIQLIDKTFCNQQRCNNHSNLEKYLNISKQNCYRLLKLINNLIDVTKIDSGFMKMNFKNYNIVCIIEDITLSISEYIESKGITLIFDTEIEEKITACDAEKLERVMLNILSNAVKFTEAGGSINVNIYDKGESIHISIKDTGIGIPDDMKEKIFDRFKQVDSSLHRNAEGSGIGLSLVKSIVELHNGSITLQSEIDKGSEFIIELPVSLIDQKSDVQEEVATALHSNVEKARIEFSDIYS